MEVFKSASFFGQIGVPNTQNCPQWELSKQQTVHPPKGELNIQKALRLEMGMELVIYTFHQIFQSNTHALQPRLRICIVVLNVIEQLSQTPIRVAFHMHQHRRLNNSTDIAAQYVTDGMRFIHYQGNRLDGTSISQRRQQVVHPLYISRGGVPCRPYAQDALHRLLNRPLLKKRQIRTCSRQINQDLSHHFAVPVQISNFIVVMNGISIFLSLAAYSLFATSILVATATPLPGIDTVHRSSSTCAMLLSLYCQHPESVHIAAYGSCVLAGTLRLPLLWAWSRQQDHQLLHYYC